MVQSKFSDVPIVMVVDESADNRQMYAEYLRLNGFEPVEIRTTDDALRRAVAADIIVTDIRVPGSFDGVELVRHLRAGAATKRKRVIVLTACAFESEEKRAQAAGCDAFLAKPCLPDTLVGEIRRLLPPTRVLREHAHHRGIHALKARLKSQHLVNRFTELQNRVRRRG